MAVISNYNPQLHDIYEYTGTPTINRVNPPGNNCLVYATAYNRRNFLKNGEYDLPDIDWSGIQVRLRGFINYGWDQTRSALGQFNPGFGQSSSVCFDTGCPPGDFSKAENYNYWNNGQWTMILISPRHLLVCQHYAGGYGINMTTDVRFIGKDGTIYPPKTARKAVAIGGFNYSGGDVDLAAGVISVGSVKQDFFIYRLDTPLTNQEQQNIKIYPIAKPETIPINTKIFVQDPNARIYVQNVIGHSFGAPVTVPYNTDPTLPILESGVHFGDSGSPALVYLNGETCFFSNYYGGGPLNKENISALTEYILQDSGYTLRLIDGGFVQDTIPEIEEIQEINPLSQFPYLSRFSGSIQSFNFERIAYVRRSQVQASELNEIQEIFYNQQSKTIEMVNNWFGNRLLKQQTNGITFSGPTNIAGFISKKYDSNLFHPKWSIMTPLHPNQVKKSANDNITILSGWYFLKAVNSVLDPNYNPNSSQTQTPVGGADKKSTIYRWIFNPIDYTVYLNNSEYFAVGTSSYLLYGDNDYLQDNSYPEYESKPSGGNRFAVEVTNQIYTETIPTSGITMENPLVIYKQNDRYYLPNGSEII